jgi:hypothetical protein
LEDNLKVRKRELNYCKVVCRKHALDN